MLLCFAASKHLLHSVCAAGRCRIRALLMLRILMLVAGVIVCVNIVVVTAWVVAEEFEDLELVLHDGVKRLQRYRPHTERERERERERESHPLVYMQKTEGHSVGAALIGMGLGLRCRVSGLGFAEG